MPLINTRPDYGQSRLCSSILILDELAAGCNANKVVSRKLKYPDRIMLIMQKEYLTGIIDGTSMNYRIAITWNLLFLLLFVAGCDKGNIPDPFSEPGDLNLVPMADFKKILAGLPDDIVVLTGHSAVTLVPEGRKTFRFFDFDDDTASEMFFEQGVFHWLDNRPNPARAGYVLSELNLSMRFLISAPGPVWTPVAAVEVDSGKLICLAKRTAPIAQQVTTSKAAQPNRLVKVGRGKDSFEIFKHEVTNINFAQFLNLKSFDYMSVDTYYSIKHPTSAIVYLDGEYKVYKGWGNLPVYNVSQIGARDYCRELGFSLPTSEQFRQAAGYSAGRPFPWGKAADYRDRANLAGSEDGFSFLAPVGAFKKGASPAGVFDLSGNVYEWLQGGALAGGSWIHGIDRAALSFTDNNYVTARNLHDGFRCVAKVK